jgi:hypothetical protein
MRKEKNKKRKKYMGITYQGKKKFLLLQKGCSHRL